MIYLLAEGCSPLLCLFKELREETQPYATSKKESMMSHKNTLMIHVGAASFLFGAFLKIFNRSMVV
ncbi:hypothetical protein ACTXN8_12175 [Pseudomonas helleri]|uniref:hypothetical protein n=1 Tax=Pseudomonas helleri TaxID=1608996 RepID=UPI003FD13861